MSCRIGVTRAQRWWRFRVRQQRWIEIGNAAEQCYFDGWGDGSAAAGGGNARALGADDDPGDAAAGEWE